mgnify:CR=1 FL=1
MKLYEQLADTLSERIKQGYFQTGDKLPSIRSLSTEHGVSISTVQEAYRLLEDRGLAAPRPKSGYYVSPQIESPPLPTVDSALQKPLQVSKWAHVLHMFNRPDTDGIIYLSVALPDLSSSTLKPIQTTMSDLFRRIGLRGLAYDRLNGAEELRRQLARLSIDSGSQLSPDEIVITTGCQEALSISLRTVAQPGDVIAIESPGFFGSLQAIEASGLKALEIPCHPETGMSMEALELALEQWPVKAILTTPIFNNPAGHCMPDAHKQRMLALAQRYDIPIIEDDIYGDLSYSYPRPRTIKSFDTEGRVILCSSSSKTMAPGLRVGWVSPGRYLQQIMHMKYITSMSSTTMPQLAIAEFIAQGGYERHLRQTGQPVDPVRIRHGAALRDFTDPSEAERILETLSELNADAGMTILLVAHQLELVSRAARRFLWVAGGRVDEVTAAELRGAVLRCMLCEEPDDCEARLAEALESGAHIEVPEYCRNRALMERIARD